MTKLFLLTLIGAFATMPGLAQNASPMPKPPTAPVGSDLASAPSWADLSPAEKSALAPLSTHFDRLEKQQRRKWRALATKFPSFPPEKQKTIQARMVAWANMTPEQRTSIRQQALANREMKGNRSESWSKWVDLEDESKSNLHEKALKVKP